MPIYRIKAPDGNTYRLNGPDDATPQELEAALAEQVPYALKTTEELKAEKSAPFSAADLARVTTAGGAAGIQALTDIFGAGNAVSQALEQYQMRQMGELTPARLEEMRRREEIKKRAKTTGEEVSAYLGGFTEAPFQTSAQALASSLPIIAGGFIPGGQAAAGTALAARAAPLLTRTQAVQTGIGALMGLGGQKGQEFQTVRDALIEKGMKSDEAIEVAKQVSAYGLESLPRQLAAAVAGALEGRFGAENIISSALTKKSLQKGITGVTKPATWSEAIGSSVIGESAPEALQAAVGTIGSNLALNQAGIPTNITEGLAGSVAHDALVGAVLGLGVSPAQKANLTREFEQARVEEDRKRREEIEKERQEAASALEKELAQTRERLGIQTGMLALPAPAKEAVPEQDLFQDPLGRVKREELAPKVVQYIDEYRAGASLPKLKDFSIEDVRDAMTQVYPKGEKAALNSIITAKTGFTGKKKYTPEDVLNAAAKANVATGTQGFKDFLARATGESDLNAMSQPQLFSAFKALDRVGDRTAMETQVLPEGSNASRFTEDQLNEGLTLLGKYMEQSDGRLTEQQALDIIKAQTKLKEDRDAKTLLRSAEMQDLLYAQRGKVYSTINKDGEITGQYSTKEQADEAKKAKETVQESDGKLYAVSPETKPREVLPAGYELEEKTLEAGEGPAEVQVVPAGRAKPIARVPTMEEVQGKIDRLTGLRQKEAEKTLADIDKYKQSIAKAERALEGMEARGEEGTEGYNKAKAKLARQKDVVNRRLKALDDRVKEMTAPLKAKPVGRKPVTRQAVTVKKDGKVVGTYPDRATAIESILPSLSDKELEDLAVKGGVMGDRAAKALEERKKPGVRVKGTKEGLEKAGVDTTEFREKLKALEEKLLPMLAKFGLKDVGLKVVREIEKGAEGSYAAKLIQIAIDAEKPITTMRHEAIHALKELGFFTPQQWKALEDRAKKDWIPQYLEGINAEVDGEVMTRLEAYKKMGLTPSEIIEEAIADAFADFDATKPPPGMLQALLNKIKAFFKALRSGLTGAGFESAEEIFGKIEKGELTPGALDETPEVKLSLKKPGSDIGHKREASTGRYVGAPDWVGASSQQLTALRKKLKKLALEGERGRYWYENSSKAILELAGGDKKEAEKIVSLIAIYSPNATVPANTSMALNAYYQYKTGQPINAGFSEADAKAEDLLRNNNPWSGIKTNSFYQNLMVEIDPSKLDPGVATMDMWMALAFDYGMKALDQGPKYKFAEREIQRLAKDLGWDAHQVQAAIWTAMKGRIDPIRDLLKEKEIKLGIGQMIEKTDPRTNKPKMVYEVKKDRRYDHFRLAHQLGMEYQVTNEDLNASKYDFSDAIRDRSAQISWEATPGASTGVLPGIFDATTAQKLEYLTDIQDVLTDPAGRDKIAEAIGLPSGKTLLGFSAWQGDIGAGAQTFTGVALKDIKDKRDVTPEVRKLLNLYCAIKGYVLNQEAVVWQVPSYDGAQYKQNGVEGMFNRALSESEMRKLYNALREEFGTWEIAPGYTANGFRLLNFTDIDNKTFQNGVVKVLENMPEDFGGGMIDLKRYRSIGDYISNDWKEAPNGEQYAEQIESAANEIGGERRSDLLDWANNLRSDVEAVNKEYAKKYGWGKTGTTEGKKLSLRAPNTRAFDEWFGDSKIVDKNFQPKVMYHGLAKDTTDFTRKTARGAPIFLTDDPEFAARFAADSYDEMANRPDQYLTESQIKDGVKRAISAIRKDYGKDSLGKQMIESLKTGNLKDALPETRDYLRKEFVNLLPSGPHIMALYVRAENPFDYQNPRHIYRLKEEVELDDDVWNSVRDGDWEAIESSDVQDAIKSAGFDSFYVKESGRKNLAVYEPNQVKSATGNVGTFSRESPDVRYSLRKAYPTGEEAKKAAESVPTPDSPEFKRWFRESQFQKDGKPVIMYHGTAVDFTEFRGKQAGAIFVTSKPEFAEEFGETSEAYLRKQVYRAMNKADKVAFFQNIVNRALGENAISEQEAKQVMSSVKKAAPEYGKFFGGTIEEMAIKDLNDMNLYKDRIMPVYVSAQNVFDFENPKHVELVMNWVANNYDMGRKDNPEQFLANQKGLLARGSWTTIEKDHIQSAIRALGFDGFSVKEGGVKNFAVYSPWQVKSVTANNGQFDPTKNDIRYSLKRSIKPLPSVSTQEEALVNGKTQPRDRKGWVDRLMSAIGPKDFDYFRQKALDRYNELSVIDKIVAEKMGGKDLLGEASAHKMALLSDLSSGVTASVIGYGDRTGGIPLYRNGATVVDSSVKGLAELLAPLAQYEDAAKAFQYLQFVMAVKRGTRLDARGKQIGITEADRALAEKFKREMPELKQVAEDYAKFNDGIVKYLVDTGVLSKERAEEYTKYADYVPFYRQMDGEETVGPRLFHAVAGVKQGKKLKGGKLEERPIGDFLETIIRNTQSAINAGMKNAAAQVAAKNAVMANIAERVQDDKGNDVIKTGVEYFQVMENGKQVSYRTHDVLLVDALSSLNMSELPFLGVLAAPSNWLRNLVTKDPAFMMANLLRDSMSAWVTSGQKMTPVAGTVMSFVKSLKGQSPAFKALLDAGVIGGYEFSDNLENSGLRLEKDLQKKYGETKGVGAKVLKSANSVWEALEKGTTASDAATRALVYEQVMADTGNEVEALARSLEVMNFNRKGSSPLIRILTAAVPFLNARMQGLDLFYRAGIAPWFDKSPTEQQKAVQRAFWTRGAFLMGVSLMYYAMVHDDDEWKKQEQETKDNNWIVPQLGVKIPIPFEVGVLFKVIPERIAAYSFGNNTGEDFLKSMGRNLWGTLGFNPIPQAFKPIVEVATNYNFFTGRKIIGQGMEDVDSVYQTVPGTSKVAEAIAQSIGASPMKVDHLIKGYTGSIGIYVTDIVDMILDANSDSPKASKRFAQLPIIKRFAVDPEARGNLTAYYELKDASDMLVRTMNLLERAGKPEEYAAYVQKHAGLFATRDYVLDLEKQMKELREMRQTVQSMPIAGDDKRDMLVEIGRKENNLVSNIGEIKKFIASMQ